MDSGSDVDITPEDENPEFEIVEPTGPRRGRNLVAANGTPISIKGQKVIMFCTKEGHNLDWPFLAGKVKKTLKSVGTTCDAGSYCIFTWWGGYIVREKTGDSIEFTRVKNTYVIDVWIRPAKGSTESVFSRQVASP